MRQLHLGPCLRLVALVVVAITASACGNKSESAVEQGGERQDCYPNHTCDEGLTCLSNLCVALPNGSMVGRDAGATGHDAGASSDEASTERFQELPLIPSAPGALWDTSTDCFATTNCTKGGITPRTNADVAGTPYCSKGTTAPLDSNNWGAAIYLYFGSPTFNAVGMNIAGFRFDLTGSDVDVDVRSIMTPTAVYPIAEAGTATAGHNTVLLKELMSFDPQEPFDPNRFLFVDFNIFAAPQAMDFDVCISNFKFLVPAP
jgi:hypothetical protein